MLEMSGIWPPPAGPTLVGLTPPKETGFSLGITVACGLVLAAALRAAGAVDFLTAGSGSAPAAAAVNPRPRNSRRWPC